MVMERKLESESSKIHRRSQNVYELLRTDMNTRAGINGAQQGGTEAPPTHSGSGLLDVFPGRLPPHPHYAISSSSAVNQKPARENSKFPLKISGIAYQAILPNKQ